MIMSMQHSSASLIIALLAIVVAPRGSRGGVTGYCPNDLVKQVYLSSSKYTALNGYLLVLLGLLGASWGGGLVGGCYVEVTVGCHGAEAGKGDKKKSSVDNLQASGGTFICPTHRAYNVFWIFSKKTLATKWTADSGYPTAFGIKVRFVFLYELRAMESGIGNGISSNIRMKPSGKVTASMILTCIVAASCGLIFGYDIGISGGVTTMEPFLRKFFPVVLRKMAETTGNTYCVYDCEVLTLFTSSLYIAGLASSLVASRVTKVMGRKATMVLGGITFLIGVAINGAAVNIAMLILGRILLGFGVGFTNQATPVYISEMAPPKWRGAFSSSFQLFIGIGVIVATVINFGATRLGSWGWRLSLGLAAAPAAFMTLGALLVTDTPSSLVDRGKVVQAQQALLKVRGVNSNVEAELNQLIVASEATKEVYKEPFKTIFERQYRPHLVMSIAIPFFQQLTGINVIAFYAPVLFQSIGFGNDSALIGAIILGVVNFISITISMFIVDRYGRRVLFMQGGIQMIICQVALACLLGAELGISGDQPLSRTSTILVLILMCIYAAGFGWSWGPLSWLIPSEIFPMNIRLAGQSISVAVNFLTTFVLAQTFLTMLCHFKFAIFLFYAVWIAMMTGFVAVFLPETKGVPLESMHTVWERHWYWSRFSA